VNSNRGPFPTVSFKDQIDANVLAPMSAVYSGEITADVLGAPLGAVRGPARVVDVFLSVEASGKDDTNTLSWTCDVLINSTTCITTAPIIAHVSGEASQQKTTKVTGDTGITQAVIDTDANSCTDGDVISYTLVLTRTASPTTEMRNGIMVVEFSPV